MTNPHGIIRFGTQVYCLCGSDMRRESKPQVMRPLGYQFPLYTCEAGGSTFGGAHEPITSDLDAELTEAAREHSYDTHHNDARGGY